GDDVPGVPDRRGPEFADGGLLGRPRRAGVLTQALDLVQRLRVRGAGQRRRRLGAKLRCALQDEWPHVAPVGKGGGREVRRRRPGVGGLGGRSERSWHRGGTVVRGNLQNSCRDGIADLDAVLLVGSTGYGGELSIG